MKKKVFAIVFLCIVMSFIIFGIYNKKETNVVAYNGAKLLISVDGQATSILPTTGVYYLTSYTCEDANTVVNWDYKNYKLTVSNGKNGGVAFCDLEFKTSLNKLLSEVPIGSYVKYTGYGGTVGTTAVACKNGGSASSSTESDETEAPNSCMGQNAREDLDTSGYTYGYCYNDDYKYYVTGWRLAYVEDSKPVIISAGSPECNNREESIANEVYSQKADALSLKYCNSNFTAENCVCNSVRDGFCSSSSTDAAGIDGFKFNKMTKAMFGTSTYLYVTLDGEDNTIDCGASFTVKECGYNNDLLDNGGYYWFGAKYSLSDNYGVYWYPSWRSVNISWGTFAYGLRPLITLSSSVYVTGGAGTMDDPYTIANNSFSINNGGGYTDSSTVTLRFSALPDVTQMCISTTSATCTNYVTFAETSSLNLGADGEKTVYVYYKNSAGDVVASLTETVTVDTVGVTGGSVSIANGSSNYRKLSLSATGADYMCLSETGNTLNDCTWYDYSSSYNWTFDEGDGTGTRTIYVHFKDNAGHTIGPYSATITCNGNCETNYFMDSYNYQNIFIMRSDGATAKVNYANATVSWSTENSYAMHSCGAYNRDTSTYSIWCIGDDNNVYYKTTYNATSWKVVNTSSYIDVSQYSYSVYPHSNTYAYIVRSDGKNNRVSTSAIANTSWSYGANKPMAACTGYSTTRLACIGTDGYYYYKNSTSAIWNTTTAYSGGTNLYLTDRTKNNTWIDLYYNSNDSSTYRIHLIESDGTNLHNWRFSIGNGTGTEYTSTIPGGGIKTCTSDGYGTAHRNYCISDDGYLYTKVYTDTTWVQKTLIIES